MKRPAENLSREPMAIGTFEAAVSRSQRRGRAQKIPPIVDVSP